jgi:anti-sigma-K factor RskA
MNDNHLPDEEVLRLVFGELDAARLDAVRQAVAEDAELAATARGLEAAVVAVRAENVGRLSDDFSDRLRQRMPEVFDHAQPGTTRTTFLTRSLDTWRWIMRSPVSRVTAAVFVLAITGVAVWFHGRGATPALADFLEPILEAKTVKCKMTTEFTALSVQMKLLPEAMQRDLRKTTSEVMMLGATRKRTVTVNPDKSKTIHIWDGGQGKSISLLPAQKRAEVFDDANKPRDKAPNGGDPVAKWRSMLLDAHDRPDAKRESLGEKVIDGRQVVGFRISSPATVFEVWGDPKTGLPARVEMTAAAVPEVKLTISDFEFNVDMDESLFSVEPPAGYEIIEDPR